MGSYIQTEFPTNQRVLASLIRNLKASPLSSQSERSTDTCTGFVETDIEVISTAVGSAKDVIQSR